MSDILAFLTWWLLVCLAGWLVWPLLFHMLPRLPERGYALSKACGLLLIGYVLWILSALGYLRISGGGVLFSAVVVTCLALRFGNAGGALNWLGKHVRLMFVVEGVFFVCFAIFAYVRALNPDIVGTEKPMEFAFLNSILRGAEIPPRDPWLSGYAISYYYFGYVIIGMLTRVSGVLPGVGFNLGVALMFGLAAVGSFGVVLNLIVLSMGNRTEDSAARLSRRAFPALLGPVYTVVTGNLAGLLEVIHHRGMGADRFWQWLGIKWLDAAPTASVGWIPERYLWWWQASRVIRDRDLAGTPVAVQPIDEFPLFSFLLGDLHPHVLALPFVYLAIAFSLELFLMAGGTGLRKLHWFLMPISKFMIVALVLGGLAFLNTWDFPIYLCLVIAGYAAGRRECGVLEFRLAVSLGVVAVLCYLPFYVGFRSQAAGILPNPIFSTQVNQFAVLFAVLLVPALAWLLWESIGMEHARNWRLGMLVGPGILAVLVVSCLLLTSVMIANPDIRSMYKALDGLSRNTVSEGMLIVVRHRMSSGPWTAVLLTCTLFFAGTMVGNRYQSRGRVVGVTPFVALLVAVGAILALVPEYIYLRDGFNSRMNTMFKFYYQAWALWSLVAAYGIWRLRECSSVKIKIMLWPVVVFTLAAGLLYSVLAIWTKTDGLQGTTVINGKHVPSLDGAAVMARSYPDDYAAVSWLNFFLQGDGVIAEAVGGSYSDYGRVSTYSGLPTLLGWPGHELQWRGGFELASGREEAIKTLYSARGWEETARIMRQYDITYVYVGTLERQSFPGMGIEKFEDNMNAIYRNSGVTIYEWID